MKNRGWWREKESSGGEKGERSQKYSADWSDRNSLQSVELKFCCVGASGRLRVGVGVGGRRCGYGFGGGGMRVKEP